MSDVLAGFPEGRNAYPEKIPQNREAAKRFIIFYL